MTEVFKIDDGVWHWVIAESESDAFAVYREQMVRDDPAREWVNELGVTATKLTPLQRVSTKYWGDSSDEMLGTMQSEFARDSSRRYVGCSEW